MGFSATRNSVIEAMYRFENLTSCHSEECNSEVEWWTSEKDENMPLNMTNNGYIHAIAHFVSCPSSEEFRRQ